jgi:uncharacterized protein
MPPLKYHSGQTEIQAEAKTTPVAEKLAYWVGPVAEFAQGADLFLLATANSDDTLCFTVLSGTPPFFQVLGESGLRAEPDEPPEESALRIRFQSDLTSLVSKPTPCGGLALNLAQARRARINGLLTPYSDTTELQATETFTLCRKYMAPSLPLDNASHLGPVAREPLPLDDPWLTGLLAKAETAFLATISPEGGPDVAHRGGPPGFLEFDPAARRLTWGEYVGDGVFKSAGNIRANGAMTLLVPDLESGDGVELIGQGQYINRRTQRGQRLDPLVQQPEHFPLQGVMTFEISQALRLQALMPPRRRIKKTTITSRSTVDEQAPQ